jgi:hypothetical protein
VIKISAKAEVRVHCLFPRSASPGGVKSSCMAYALKQIKGYSISLEDRTKLFRRALEIGRQITSMNDVDGILPLPSSYDLVDRACHVLQVRLPMRPPIVSIFRRPTVREVLNDLLPVHRVPASLREGYSIEVSRLKRRPEQEVLKLKCIPVRLRRHFMTMCVTNCAPIQQCHHVLIVDDVISTGITFPKRYASSA